MELREELQKAERELEGTKRRWILHEADRRRRGGRGEAGGGKQQMMTPIRQKAVLVGTGGRLQDREENMDRWGTDERPGSALTKLELLVQSPPPGASAPGDTDPGSLHKQQQQQQHAGRGRVLSGQRHIRPLSLLGPEEYEPGSISTVLSPDTVRSPLSERARTPGVDALFFTHPSNSYVPPTPIRNGCRSRSPEAGRRGRATTGSSSMAGSGGAAAAALDGNPGGGGGGGGIGAPNLARTGKKIAKDFQDGLWTFLGDLKQATISNEGARSASPARNGVHDHLASTVS